MSPSSRFRRVGVRWFVLLDGGIVALAVFAASDAARRRAHPVAPSRRGARRLLWMTAAIHVGEAAYAGRTAKRHGLPVVPWVTQTLIVGFPSLRALGQVNAGG